MSQVASPPKTPETQVRVPYKSGSSKYKKPLSLYNQKQPKKSVSTIAPYKTTIRKVNKVYKIVILLFFIGVLTGFAGYFFTFSTYFDIKNVQIDGARKFVSLTDITTITKEKVMGKNINFFDTLSFQNSLQEIFLGAKTINVQKKLPDEILITVTERKPIAVVHNSFSTELYLVDATGYIIGIVDETTNDLPKVVYEGDLKIGKTINDQLIPSYIEMFKAFTDEQIKFSSMSFYPEYVHVTLSDGVDLLIGDQKKKRDAIKLVGDLLKQIRIEGKTVRKIDLRYDKVIVEY